MEQTELSQLEVLSAEQVERLYEVCGYTARMAADLSHRLSARGKLLRLSGPEGQQVCDAALALYKVVLALEFALHRSGRL
jgi:hypothetical protein